MRNHAIKTKRHDPRRDLVSLMGPAQKREEQNLKKNLPGNIKPFGERGMTYLAPRCIGCTDLTGGSGNNRQDRTLG
jgi:hypothetical protein